MKKDRLVLVIIFALFLINISLISAEIFLSQPNPAYNLGDNVELNIEVTSFGEGFLKVDLICGDNTINILNKVILDDKDKVSNIRLPLLYSYISDSIGICQFQVEYGGVIQSTRQFEITTNLIVRLNRDDIIANPGEKIIIEGTAYKIDGRSVNGIIKIEIPLMSRFIAESSAENQLNITEEDLSPEDFETENKINKGIYDGYIKDSKFLLNISLRDDLPAGDYRIDAIAYEKYNDEIINKGTYMSNLKVNQILKRIEIPIEDQPIDPGEIFNFQVQLYDQADMVIYDDVFVIIANEKEKRIFEDIFESYENIEYNVPTNLTSGYYTITVENNNKKEMRQIFINEKAIAKFELRNSTLTVTNIGNTPYNKNIKVELNGESFVRKVNLGLGESQEFKLSGDGTFEVYISDGEGVETYSGVILTGGAINVKEISGSIIRNPIVWIFLIIILGAGILFFMRNTLKKKSFARPFTKAFLLFHKKKAQIPVGSSTPITNGRENLKHLIMPKQAESVPVLDGVKNSAVIVALKIKNQMDKDAHLFLEKVLRIVYSKKAVIYLSGNYVFIIFTPLITRTFKNEIDAIKTAQTINNLLKQYNQQAEGEIHYGIGVCVGDIVNKIQDKKLKFTALGNLLGEARKIAEASKYEVLLSKEAHRKSMTDAKVDKKEIKDLEVYEVKKIIDNEKNKEFIDSFLERLEKEKK